MGYDGGNREVISFLRDGDGMKRKGRLSFGALFEGNHYK